MLNINEEALKTAIVAQVADQLLREDEDLSDMVAKEVKKRIDKIFDERVTAQIQRAIDETINGSFEREYRRVNQWGDQEGPSTTLRKELEKTVTAYWNGKVNPGDGKPATSDYNSVTRAQWLMTKICAEDFSKEMQQHVTNVTGSLKDGLRKQMANQMDALLNDLFKVRSLQDQGKVEKPY
ncbi:hypothetical protein NJF44_10510 [Pseudomonas guariconensis]|uniref:hypothetical protein n=1 Tax=Pseudomonas TaxID=286 RepID=UPI002097D76E|nr:MULTISPECIES: hypothetical protein [Pseudomonas]MCO7515748.1 hypothetical protein [Pseudomonas putida]MCO7605660.1 hypothetical protein [Pseudomonas guariconensis]